MKIELNIKNIEKDQAILKAEEKEIAIPTSWLPNQAKIGEKVILSIEKDGPEGNQEIAKDVLNELLNTSETI